MAPQRTPEDMIDLDDLDDEDEFPDDFGGVLQQIWEWPSKLEVHIKAGNRLYLGHGDWLKDTGSTDIIYYDFGQQKFVKEFTADEEAIVRYRRCGNRLILPGIDSTESWEFGNLYVHKASGWKKHRTIPRGLHVFDFAEYAGRWYVATGSNFGDLKTGNQSTPSHAKTGH